MQQLEAAADDEGRWLHTQLIDVNQSVANESVTTLATSSNEVEIIVMLMKSEDEDMNADVVVPLRLYVNGNVDQPTLT